MLRDCQLVPGWRLGSISSARTLFTPLPPSPASLPHAGHKRWVLFPPGTPNSLIKPPGVEREAASWFTHVWPRTQAADWPGPRPLHIIQRPGETCAWLWGGATKWALLSGRGLPGLPASHTPTPHRPRPVLTPSHLCSMFVPAGWPHVVLNLNLTVAVTQNYVSTATFADAWRHTKRGRPKMSAKWLATLRAARPDLAAIAGAAGCGAECRAGPARCMLSKRLLHRVGTCVAHANPPTPPAAACRYAGGRRQRRDWHLEQQQQQQLI